MTSSAPTPSTSPIAPGAAERVAPARGGSLPAALGYLLYCEIVKLMRVPAFAIPTFLFPIMFFAMFGLPNARREIEGINAGAYIMASYGAYSVISVALFSFGVSIAAERGLGWNRLLRTTPLQPLALFAAKTAMALLFGLVTLLLLFGFGALAAGVRMAPPLWGTLLLLLLLGMVPFVALGLLLGYVGGPNSAAAIANVIFLPLSFASGLFVPLDFLPEVVRKVAPYLPAYHVGQLGWTALGAGDGQPLGGHALWLAGYTVAFLTLATIAYRRDEGKNYG
jgi:ABC-2 type transport system permease protein